MKAWILAAEAIAVYGLVLWSHSLRHRYGLAFFYSLIGCLAAIMSWVTDANVVVMLGDFSFLVGSTVFYTSLLLGVFVVYVFDGPRATRVAILTIVGISILVPVVSVLLHLQTRLSSTVPLGQVPIPSLRINTASVLTTLADLLFLAVAWQFLHSAVRRVPLAVKSFLTLLGVMCLDVVLFNTGAFLGTPEYASIMSGTLISRVLITAFAAPVLWAYLSWQSSLPGAEMPHRPVFSILRELTELQVELQSAQAEITRRIKAEAMLQQSEKRYRQLIQNAGEAIAVVRNGLYLLHNRALRQLVGLTEETAATASLADFIHPDDLPQVQAEMEAALRHPGQSRSVEFRSARPGGETLAVNASLVGMEWDGAPALIAFLHDVTLQRLAERSLMDKAMRDPLTGVLNRRGFLDCLNAASQRLSGQGQAYSMLFLDLDDFKAVNDSLGHAAGDAALRHVAQSALDHTREGDLVGRLGGDEFAVFLAHTDIEEAQRIALRIQASIAQNRPQAQGGPIVVTASIGCSSSVPALVQDGEGLMEQADRAMLQAKRHGPGRVFILAPGHTQPSACTQG